MPYDTMVPEPDDTQRTSDVQVLACGGSGCCPIVEVHPEGVRLLDRDDGRDYDRLLTHDQAETLSRWLQAKGYGTR